MQYNMNEIVAESDLVFITLDTLRYDVAQRLWIEGKLPNFSKWLPSEGWEQRHSPGSFTYAAHHAFFAGFLPTPIAPGKHPRLFATQFEGSETAVLNTCTFDASNIIEGFQQKGFKTICIGGVGFFNKQTPLSTVFPNLFEESYWEESFGVTNKHSTQIQLKKAANLLEKNPAPVFLFINISALHQPNYFYLDNNSEDTIESHAAALEYVDSQLPILMEALDKRKQTFVICSADHGTTYGEDGYTGHRIGHPKVWNVPYLEILLTTLS
ncbi:MAG: STM4013/SEN3800 family hydrolase [Aureispira sp.]|nr:STM4013/SEN3800 family hydrolase [Aureispira sp.]